MRSLVGCRKCGHVEFVEGESEAGEERGTCPRCGGKLRGVGLLGAHLLAQSMRRTEAERGSGERRTEGCSTG